MPLPPVLDRFLQAQEPVWPRVIAELRAGKKRTHWMWFVFPQIQGLGHSDMAQRYAIQSMAEAQAYLAHPVLAGRLRECCQILLDLEEIEEEVPLPKTAGNNFVAACDNLAFAV